MRKSWKELILIQCLSMKFLASESNKCARVVKNDDIIYIIVQLQSTYIKSNILLCIYIYIWFISILG